MANYVLTPVAVRKLTEALRKRTGDSIGGTSASPVDERDFPPLFTVRWSQTENSGAGAWCVWIPDTTNALVYSGASVTISGLTAATSLPSGWYVLSGFSSTVDIWLVLSVVDSTGAASAVIASSAGQSTTGTTVYNILVAKCTTTAATGEKQVRQNVCSVVSIGGGGAAATAPDDISIDNIGGTNDDALEIKGWKADSPSASESVAADLCATSRSGDEYVVRASDGTLAYKTSGGFLCGSDSNIVFTIINGLNGGLNVEVDIYYK